MANSIHVGDVGTVFKVRILSDLDNTPINLSDTTVRTIKFEKPNGHVLLKDADFTTDGLDGYMQYITVAGDLTSAGTWSIQGYVENLTYENSSDISFFEVKENIVQ